MEELQQMHDKMKDGPMKKQLAKDIAYYKKKNESKTTKKAIKPLESYSKPSIKEEVKEKPKRKSRFEKGSQEAKDFMASIRKTKTKD